MADSNSSFLSWVGGILAAVITGVLLWWLTGPRSPFHSSIPSGQQAVVEIADFNLKSPINIGESTICSFEVTNTGNAKATDCQLIWNTPGLNGNKTSEQFDLSPGETKNIRLQSNPFKKDGQFSTTATVISSNASTVSDERPIVVNFAIDIGKGIKR